MKFSLNYLTILEVNIALKVIDIIINEYNYNVYLDNGNLIAEK